LFIISNIFGAHRVPLRFTCRFKLPCELLNHLCKVMHELNVDVLDHDALWLCHPCGAGGSATIAPDPAPRARVDSIDWPASRKPRRRGVIVADRQIGPAASAECDLARRAPGARMIGADRRIG
jgi:hypothetical protein